jgi:hypothetical protein
LCGVQHSQPFLCLLDSNFGFRNILNEPSSFPRSRTPPQSIDSPSCCKANFSNLD